MTAMPKASDIPTKAGNEQHHVPDPTPANVKLRTRDRDRTLEALQAAILKVKNKGQKLTISAVAAEVGVTPGLIHNTYPDVAEAIRTQVGRGIRQQRDETLAELAEARKQCRKLREERDAAVADLARIASINETLRDQLATLKAISDGKVTMLPSTDKG